MSQTVEEIEAKMKELWGQGDHVGWSMLWWVRRDMVKDLEARMPRS